MLTKKYFGALIFFMVLMAYWSCQTSNTNKDEDVQQFEIAFTTSELLYNLAKPDTILKLPSELKEVSGLSWTKLGRLAMVQDEKGTIFQMDIQKWEMLEESYEFEGRGDFEGIEIVEDTAYVLRSDGVIFSVFPYKSPEPKIEVYKTSLERRNDTEGLSYLAERHQLLISCKAIPNISGKKEKDHRAVYLFDLRTKSLSDTPFLRIPIKNILKAIDDNTYNRLSKDIVEVFSKGGDISFQPSAIAIHPITSDIYILASVGKLLVVYNQNGAMTNIVKLKKSVFKQPEGICFNPEGDLFISNEGRKGKANILKFNYQSLRKGE